MGIERRPDKLLALSQYPQLISQGGNFIQLRDELWRGTENRLAEGSEGTITLTAQTMSPDQRVSYSVGGQVGGFPRGTGYFRQAESSQVGVLTGRGSVKGGKLIEKAVAVVVLLLF